MGWTTEDALGILFWSEGAGILRALFFGTTTSNTQSKEKK